VTDNRAAEDPIVEVPAPDVIEFECPVPADPIASVVVVELPSD
jgi:hypothetical protein